jgi:hypothetical protein
LPAAPVRAWQGALQGFGELGRGLKAIGREFLQRPRHGSIDMGGNRLPLKGDGKRFLGHDSRENRLCGRAGKRRLAHEHLIRDRAERIHIAPRVQPLLSGGLLGAHVVRSTEAHPRLGDAGGAVAAAAGQRNAEVGDQGAAVVEQHIVRLDIAMDHAMAVSVVEPLCDLDGDSHGVGDRQLRLPDEPVAE